MKKLVIPKQPEVNIGTAGHVDHGKCLSIDEEVLIDGEATDGNSIWDVASERGKVVFEDENSKLYRLPELRALSFGPLGFVGSDALLYVQRYSGPIVELSTDRGRIRATPNHRFYGRLGWVEARDLKEGDAILAYGEGIEWARVEGVRLLDFDDYLFDLSVPYYHNFVSGNGLLCHNTTMIEAITGIWTSAHSEELRRGITIKVGYADAPIYRCKSCEPPTCYTVKPECPCGGEAELERVVSFVDCPGHESLMANMLSGAALMDGAILVIAANEDVPRPQTREHLMALQMLGTKHIVVVQNKLDLVDDKAALENYHKIRDFLEGTIAENAPIIPISAQFKLNIDAVLEAIEKFIPTPERDPKKPPLMYVLRSFDVNKPGTPIKELKGGVVGGSLIQGTLEVGEEIEIRPGIYRDGVFEPVTTKVASLGTSAGLVDRVGPGGLIAIGTYIDPTYTKSDSLVGNVVGRPNELPPVLNELTLEVQLFELAVGTPEPVRVEKIKMGEPIRLNVATAVTLGVVSGIHDDLIEMKLRRPVCASEGARAALSRRIGSRWRLIGSGVIR